MKFFHYFTISILFALLFSVGCTPKDDTATTAPPVSTTDLVADFTVQLQPTTVNGLSIDQGDVLITNTSKNATSFKWDFGDNSGPQTLSSNQFRHTYNRAGTYKISLTATGAQGTKIVEKSIVTIAGGRAIFHCSDMSASYPLTVTCDGWSQTLQSSRLSCSNCCSTPQNYVGEIAIFALQEGVNPYSITDKFGHLLSAPNAKVTITPKNCTTVLQQ